MEPALAQDTDKKEKALIELDEVHKRKVEECGKNLDKEACAFVNEDTLIKFPLDTYCPIGKSVSKGKRFIILSVVMFISAYIIPIILVILFYNSDAIDEIYATSRGILFGLSALSLGYGVWKAISYRQSCIKEVKSTSSKYYWNRGYVLDWVVSDYESDEQSGSVERKEGSA